VEKGSGPAIGVLISGRGSNLGALIQAIRAGRLTARIAVVISNVADAAGLEIARASSVEVVVMPHKGFSSREAYDTAVVAALRERGVTLVCLAGYMRLLGRGFCDAFPSAILNIHPSLLPSFPGPDAVGQAVRHGVRISGATVHFVTSELDAGPIVLQRAVPVFDNDTAEALAARVLAVEHVIYAEAIQRVLWESWRLDGRRVVFGKGSERLE
jgi:phosphoribosylglycinamide formyltransferase-1